MRLDVEWPQTLGRELLSTTDRMEAKRSAIKDQRMLNGIEAQTIVVQAGSMFWDEVNAWGMAKGGTIPR